MGCVVCGGVKNHDAYACARCKPILDRIETRRLQSGIVRRSDKQARIDALTASWDAEAGCFRCHYTGVALTEHDPRDDRHLSWERRVRGDESSVVVTSALVSRMMTDLSEAEFQRMVAGLHSRFSGGEFDEAAYPDRQPVQLRQVRAS